MNINPAKANIRKVEINDIGKMTEYRLAYLAELQGERSDDYKNTLRHELFSFFKMTMENGSFFALLAEYDGEILAFGGMVIKRIPGDFNQSSYIEGDILNMYTVPSARRKGISSLVLTQLLTEAGNLGISKVALHTTKDGEQLYRKFGFNDPAYPYLELVIKMQE